MKILPDIAGIIYRSEIEQAATCVRDTATSCSSSVNIPMIVADTRRILHERVTELAKGSILGFGDCRHSRTFKELHHILYRSIEKDSGASFRAEYLELTRCIAYVCSNIANRIVEIIERFQNDKTEIGKALIKNASCLDSIAYQISDYHEGQSCSFLVKIDGNYVVYKNKSLIVDEWFQNILQEMDEKNEWTSVSTILTNSIKNYGWMKYIEHNKCVDINELSKFYNRLGWIMSALVLLRSGDHHYENVIAANSYPFFVDLECSFIPSLVLDQSLTSRFSAKSLGVISQSSMVGNHEVDVGALAWRPGAYYVDLAWFNDHEGGPELRYKKRLVSASSSNPHKDGSLLGPKQFQKLLIRGYRSSRRRQRVLADKLKQLILSIQEEPMRLVLRKTRYYRDLLEFSFSNQYTKKSSLRRSILEHFLAADHPCLESIVNEEIESLMNAEIPVFYHRPASNIIFSRKSEYRGIIKKTGLELVLRDFPNRRPLNARS